MTHTKSTPIVTEPEFGRTDIKYETQSGETRFVYVTHATDGTVTISHGAQGTHLLVTVPAGVVPALRRALYAPELMPAQSLADSIYQQVTEDLQGAAA